MNALGPGEIRARRRPFVVLAIAGLRILSGFCLAWPLASLVASSGVGLRPEGDRALFEAGGYLLLELLRLQGGALTAASRGLVPVLLLGLVLTAACNAALLVALNANADKGACNGYGAFSVSGLPTRGTDCGRYDVTIYGGLILAAGLTAGGIPLYAIGSKKEPVRAALAPWATPNGGGLALRVDL